MDKKSFLAELEKTLQYQTLMGINSIPVSKAPSSKDLVQVKAEENPITLKNNIQSLSQLREDIGDCKLCRLCEARTNLVFGVGNPNADLMFVGEAPGRDEDLQGEPFVGRAGKLLNKIIEAMGYSRNDVYIANINKCRPPNNRPPADDEMQTCIPFLRKQIDIIAPKVIVCLGATAVRGVLQTEEKIGKLRGNFQDWDGITVMPTYHPAFLLRNPNMKKPVWEDMLKVIEFLKN